MLQIGTILIGYPDTPSPEEWNKFVTECNQRRLLAMQNQGMLITEYSDLKWNEYKQLIKK
jgi:hypothetical protein